MNWSEIIRLFIFLWPHIEKILKGIDDEKKRKKEEDKAVAAIIDMANGKTV